MYGSNIRYIYIYIYIYIWMYWVSLWCMKFVFIPFLSLRRKNTFPSFHASQRIKTSSMHSCCSILLLMKIFLMCNCCVNLCLPKVYFVLQHIFRNPHIFVGSLFLSTIFLMMQYDVWCNAMQNDVMVWCSMMFMPTTHTHTRTHPDSAFP
jgi:hypothetical protein